MKKYELLGHTADLRVLVCAENLELLFESAMESMVEVLSPATCKERSRFSVTEHISIKAPDTTVLLIDFLSEVLTASYLKRAIFCKLKCEKLNRTYINAVIYGIPVNSFQEDIKAVTYHEAEVQKDSDNNWISTIIYDI